MQIASGSLDNTLIIWDAHKHIIIKGPLTGHTGPVRSVTYSLNGTYILSGSEDHTIIIWDPITGAHQRTLKGHTNTIFSIACSPTRLHAASGSTDDTMIQVWDLETSKPIYKPLQGHAIRGAVAVAYSTDGNHIIFASCDMAIRIWDYLTGTLIRVPFIGHTGIPFAVATSPDGKHIASGGIDGLIRVWAPQLNTPSSTEPLKSHTNFIQYRVSSYNVKSAFSYISHVWRLYDPEELRQALPLQSFWDPFAKHFKSIQVPQARIIDTHQSVNESSNEPDPEVKEIQVTHSGHPMVLQGDGWLYTVDGGLLIHVPNEHWATLCDMSVMCIPENAPGCPIRLDWDAVYNAWDNIRKMMEESEQGQS